MSLNKKNDLLEVEVISAGDGTGTYRVEGERAAVYLLQGIIDTEAVCPSEMRIEVRIRRAGEDAVARVLRGTQEINDYTDEILVDPNDPEWQKFQAEKDLPIEVVWGW